MKKSNFKKILAVSLSMFIMLFATSALAVQYVPLEGNAFPGVTVSPSSLTVYLSYIFSFGIAVAVALSLVMIIWGGVLYMTTDSWMGKDEGKTKILSALEGLGIALISWLILYTINPALVDFSNNTLLN